MVSILNDSIKACKKNADIFLDDRSLTYNQCGFIFKEKPFYVDYSFFVLVDKKRHIRGYYDARYAAEVKRLIGEYQPLAH